MSLNLAALWANPDMRRFAKFVIVGVVNTGVGYGIYAVLVWAGLSPQPALAWSFVLGVAWNYLSHARLVFGSGGYRRMPWYIGAYVLIYIGNALLLALFLRLGLHPLLAQAVILPFAALSAFLMIGKALTGRWPLGQGS